MIVHPRHGVGTVQDATTRKTADGETTYLTLLFESKDMTVMVPLDSVEEVGIRHPVTKKEAKAILALLEKDADVPQAWAERNATTTSRVQSTDLTQAALVIRDLTRHAKRIDKPLSTAENATLQECLETVSRELSLSLGMSQDDTRGLILDKVGAGEAQAAEPT